MEVLVNAPFAILAEESRKTESVRRRLSGRFLSHHRDCVTLFHATVRQTRRRRHNVCIHLGVLDCDKTAGARLDADIGRFRGSNDYLVTRSVKSESGRNDNPRAG